LVSIPDYVEIILNNPSRCYNTAKELKMGEQESGRVFDVCNAWVGFVFGYGFRICCNYAQKRENYYSSA
jgi:hypothetical protein